MMKKVFLIYFWHYPSSLSTQYEPVLWQPCSDSVSLPAHGGPAAWLAYQTCAKPPKSAAFLHQICNKTYLFINLYYLILYLFNQRYRGTSFRLPSFSGVASGRAFLFVWLRGSRLLMAEWHQLHQLFPLMNHFETSHLHDHQNQSHWQPLKTFLDQLDCKIIPPSRPEVRKLEWRACLLCFYHFDSSWSSRIY